MKTRAARSFFRRGLVRCSRRRVAVAASPPGSDAQAAARPIAVPVAAVAVRRMRPAQAVRRCAHACGPWPAGVRKVRLDARRAKRAWARSLRRSLKPIGYRK